MKKSWFCGAVLAVAFAFSGVGAHAQSRPKLDVFVGYNYTTFSDLTTSINLVNQNLNGYSAEVAYNFNDHIGLVASFSGANGTHSYANSAFFDGDTVTQRADSYYYLFGPRLTQQIGKFDIFGEGLFGVSRQRFSLTDTTSKPPSNVASGSDTPLAVALGGGMDWNFASRFGWRVVEADALFTRGQATANGVEFIPSLGTSGKNLRIETGLVFHF